MLFDADGDADLDLFLANDSVSRGVDRLLLNNGSGRFTDAPSGPIQGDRRRSNAVAVGDLDGDGSQDLVVACGTIGGSPNGDRCWLNNGTGSYLANTAFPAGAGYSTGVVLGDVDGDGDLDCVVAEAARMVGSARIADMRSRLLRNDGRGGFTDVTATAWVHPVGSRHAPRLADFDGDGDLDLWIVDCPATSGRSCRLEIYRNSGQGVFRKVDPDRDHGFTFSLEVADLDRDGDPDLVSPFGALRNRRRDLTAPWLAVSGRPYRLRVGMQDGVGVRAAVVAVGALRLSRPVRLPDGAQWAVDLAGAVVLPVTVDRTGLADLDVLRVPLARYRAPIVAQAVLLPSTDPASWRVSPPVFDRIAR